jgi:hypothetical protein
MVATITEKIEAIMNDLRYHADEPLPEPLATEAEGGAEPAEVLIELPEEEEEKTFEEEVTEEELNAERTVE